MLDAAGLSSEGLCKLAQKSDISIRSRPDEMQSGVLRHLDGLVTGSGMHQASLFRQLAQQRANADKRC